MSVICGIRTRATIHPLAHDIRNKAPQTRGLTRKLGAAISAQFGLHVQVVSIRQKSLLFFQGGRGANRIKYIPRADISNGSNTKVVGGICLYFAEIPPLYLRCFNIGGECGVAGRAFGKKRDSKFGGHLAFFKFSETRVVKVSPVSNPA